ncbi:DUF7266 family protein [Methanocella arvoryzae]|nr:hypothetical protein [Methanocella arvoryzae]
MRGDRIKDDSGTSILIEYILSLTITAILFTILLLLLGNVISTTERVILDEQLGIIAGDIANRLALASTNVYNNQYNDNYYGNLIADYTVILDLPPAVRGDHYLIQINYSDASKTGTVKVAWGSNVDVNRTATFHSDTGVANTTLFYNTGNKGKIFYPDSNSKIALMVF